MQVIRYPQIYPQFSLYSIARQWVELDDLGRSKQDSNQPESPVVIGFGLWRWMVLDKKITARKQLDFTVWCGRSASTLILRPHFLRLFKSI